MRFRDLLPGRLQDSLYQRCKTYSLREELQRLRAALDLGQAPLISESPSREIHLLRTIAAIRATIQRPYNTLIDVGAHKGVFTTVAARLLEFDQYICFEPDVGLLPELRRRTEELNVTVVENALSDVDGTASLYVHGDRSMNSLLPSNKAMLQEKFPHDQTQQTMQSVSTRTLDSILPALVNMEEATFIIKLDTQGNELNILREGKQTLTRTAACLVEFMFCSPYKTTYSFHELVGFMHDCGFECCGSFDPFFRPTREVSGVDFLFERR